MKTFSTLLSLCLFLVSGSLIGQYSPPDSTALEAVVVEYYYVTDEQDSDDDDGGDVDEGSVTYRVFIDIKEDYSGQAVYSNERNVLRIASDEEWFNNEDRGEEKGSDIDNSRLGDNTVAIDSWVTIGAASDTHIGVLKVNDMDGSIVGGMNNDGGSEGVAGGLLVNDDPLAEIPLTTADGLFEVDNVLAVSESPGLDLSMFGDENSSDTLSSGGIVGQGGDTWFVAEGVQGVDDLNHILLGQFTTAGVFSFCLNVQIGIPEDLQCSNPDCHETIRYVHTLHPDDAASSVATDNIFLSESLKFNSDEVSNVPEFSDIRTLEVFPNPSKLSIQIDTPEAGENVAYTVFDIQGRPVRHVGLNGAPSSGAPISIDISTLSAGFYSLLLQIDEVTYKARFIKE